jgi:hypothetical protein
MAQSVTAVISRRYLQQTLLLPYLTLFILSTLIQTLWQAAPVFTHNGRIDGIVYLDGTAKNGFVPELPDKKVDLIYLCFPNNPTGEPFQKKSLKDGWIMQGKTGRLFYMMRPMRHL